jgi:hypothetical protein
MLFFLIWSGNHRQWGGCGGHGGNKEEGEKGRQRAHGQERPAPDATHPWPAKSRPQASSRQSSGRLWGLCLPGLPL